MWKNAIVKTNEQIVDERIPKSKHNKYDKIKDKLYTGIGKINE